jgi:hypothetical protein
MPITLCLLPTTNCMIHSELHLLKVRLLYCYYSNSSYCTIACKLENFDNIKLLCVRCLATGVKPKPPATLPKPAVVAPPVQQAPVPLTTASHGTTLAAPRPMTHKRSVSDLPAVGRDQGLAPVYPPQSGGGGVGANNSLFSNSMNNSAAMRVRSQQPQQQVTWSASTYM